MKKLMFTAFIFIILFFIFPETGTTENVEIDQDYQVIPDEAIRLRILANSDKEQDQALKNLVRDEVNKEVTNWIEHMTDIHEARALIQDRLPEIELIVADVIKKAGFNNEFSVEYGKNVVFPAKLYDNLLYPAGEYEAILITIGEGEGDNWWCVLFPPLCFLDFSSGSTVSAADAGEYEELEQEEEEQEEETEVKFFLFEWLGWS